MSTKRWEPKDADVPMLLLLGLLLVIATIFFALLSGGLFRVLSLRKDASDPRPPAMARQREGPSEPLLQVSPSADLAKYQAAQQQALHRYGWIDRPHGIVRLPIERAMDLLLERGLPATPPAGTSLQFRQQQGGIATP